MDETAVEDKGSVRGYAQAGGEEWAEDYGLGGSFRLTQEPEHSICVGEELNLFGSFSKVSFKLRCL